MTAHRAVRITEVGPRDGLQNEPEVVAVEDKVAFLDLLSETGVAEIEVSSFVSPRWVPQLADAEEVFARIRRAPGVVYSALVPNARGFARAAAAGVGKIARFTAASETFSQRNANASIDESLKRLEPVIAEARDAALPVRGYVSCAVACPYEGPIDPARVRDVAARLLEAGVTEIDLGETIGVAEPADIEKLYAGLAGLLEPADTTLHLHNTRGTALACARQALRLGVRSFDASCGGLGGCPYAPGAAGNVPTGELVAMLEAEGYATGVEPAKLAAAAARIAKVLRSPRTRPARS